jgi:hypothetical protein
MHDEDELNTVSEGCFHMRSPVTIDATRTARYSGPYAGASTPHQDHRII